MYFEVLVEDASGKIALEFILEKILGPNGQEHQYRIKPFRGIGRIPKKLKEIANPKELFLLNHLPCLLRAYGKNLQHFPAAVIVVIDLDDKDQETFKQDLLKILDDCSPQPTTLFGIAIEEGEAWLLGDEDAIKIAYPHAKRQILNSYEQDSICGTWEKLADVVHTGGAKQLKKKGWPHPGQAKCEWAEKISPYLDVEKNRSKSFQIFRTGILKLAKTQN